MADCAFELVAAAGIAEPHNMVVIFRERIGLHRLAGPRAGLIDAIGDIENVHLVKSFLEKIVEVAFRVFALGHHVLNPCIALKMPND